MADQIVEFTSRVAKKGYPKAIRCVTYYSIEQKNTYVFLTNNMVCCNYSEQKVSSERAVLRMWF